MEALSAAVWPAEEEQRGYQRKRRGKMIREVADWKIEPLKEATAEKRWCEYCGKQEYKDDTVMGGGHYFCSYVCRDAWAAGWADEQLIRAYIRKRKDGFLQFLAENSELVFDGLADERPSERVILKWGREFCGAEDGFYEWLTERREGEQWRGKE